MGWPLTVAAMALDAGAAGLAVGVGVVGVWADTESPVRTTPRTAARSSDIPRMKSSICGRRCARVRQSRPRASEQAAGLITGGELWGKAIAMDRGAATGMDMVCRP